MMRGIFTLAAALAVISSNCVSATAKAETVAPGVEFRSKSSLSGCELHIWPAERFSAVTTGWLGGGLLDVAGHAEGDRQRKASIADALDSPSQVAALAALNLSEQLGQQPSKVIVHNEPLTRHTVNSIKTRRAESKSACYSELIVADLFYQKAAIYGRSLRTLFIYREFGASPTATHIYKGWGGSGLKLFPPKPGEDIDAANNELVAVFKADFQEFARNEAAWQVTKR